VRRCSRRFQDARGLTRAEWDVTVPPPPLGPVDLVLHAAAWTDVDAAETDPQEAAAVNVGGTQHAAELGAPLVTFSSDYVFDGTKREPYVESDAPNPQSAYGRTKFHAEGAAGSDAWIVRSSWLFGWTSRNFVLTMLRLGAERDEVAVVDDQRGCPTFVGHLAAATRELIELPRGVWHIAADGDCTWAEFAEAIFEEAASTARPPDHDCGARAPGPAPRVLGPAERAPGGAAPSPLARRPPSLSRAAALARPLQLPVFFA
jgi:dTDP-4-dehydrorhamnose reductase